MLVLLAAAALALPPDVAARLDEVSALRGMRLLDDAPTIPAQAYEQALGGKVATGLVDVPGYKSRQAWGVGVVDVSIDRMWAAVNDDRSKPEYTALEHVVLLDGEFCGAERRVFQYLNVSLLSDRWWVVDQRQNTAVSERTEGKVREVIWKSVDDMHGALTGEAAALAEKGIPVGFTWGAWFLVDLGSGRTLVEYHALSDPGGSVPARMASSFAAGGISDTIESMAKLAVKGPTCL
ncbi:MAG: hypothetical protein ACI8PZ_004388 [Myxococcota bacterium]|jgi:hypothetical protein